MEPGYFPEEGVDAADPAGVTVRRERVFIVGQQGAVAVEGGDDLSVVTHEGVAQPLFEPLGAFADAMGAQLGFGFGDEGFSFAELFAAGCVLEFF